MIPLSTWNFNKIFPSGEVISSAQSKSGSINSVRRMCFRVVIMDNYSCFGCFFIFKGVSMLYSLPSAKIGKLFHFAKEYGCFVYGLTSMIRKKHQKEKNIMLISCEKFGGNRNNPYLCGVNLVHVWKQRDEKGIRCETWTVPAAVNSLCHRLKSHCPTDGKVPVIE